jgi:hypothetical protein
MKAEYELGEREYNVGLVTEDDLNMVYQPPMDDEYSHFLEVGDTPGYKVQTSRDMLRKRFYGV